MTAFNTPTTHTASSVDTLTLTRPDDWHLHVRDGDALHTVVPHTAAQFGRAIIMPNLPPPVTTAAQARAYKARILAAVAGPMPWNLSMGRAAMNSTPRSGGMTNCPFGLR